MEKFEEVYNLYFKDVYRYILSISKNTSIAEEVTQETFFKAIKGIDEFNGSCKIYVWLCQIAKNIYFDMYKKDKNNVVLYEEFNLAEDSIELNFINKETALKIHKILHNMKEPYKEVFTLRVFGELSFRHIGEIIGKNETWARVVFYRAKNRLKENLNEIDM